MIRVLIEIDQEHWQDSTIRRALAADNRLLESGELSLGDVALTTPHAEYRVSRIVGVVYPPEASSTAITVSVEPLEGFKKVTL